MQRVIVKMLPISYDVGVLIVDGEPVSRARCIHVTQAPRNGNPVATETAMQSMLDLDRQTATDYWKERNA